MADPLSVAGVVFGVVSLGLQVADGLSKYLDGVRGRTEELNWTKQQGEELKNILLTIKDLIPQIERNSPGSAPLIERHVKSCDTELSALYTLVCKLSQSATTSTGIQRLATEHARKLTYPFNRSHIVRLEKRLDRVNGTLQLALQVTTIHICVTTANQMQSWIHSSDNRISQVHDVVLSMSSLQTQNTSLTAGHWIQNRAALKGVDSSGRSLMHWVVNFSYYLSPYPGTFTDDLLSSFMANLATCGVLPGTAYDAQELACGPLSLAAVAGNEGVVKDLLQQDPQAITEINQFGHTPVHLSINQPSCLRLILEAGGSKMRDMVDFAGYAPLDYASQFEYHASTQILLASGSCIRYFSIELGRGSCIDLLFTTLRQRREELKVLALDNLTEADAMSVNLQEDTVLDDNASQVRGLLLKRHIHVPLWMSASEHWSAACHDISKLDYLWSLGFRDVDSCRPSTRTPLLTSPGITNKRWLIEHGADYWTPYKKGEDRTMLNAPITGAHFVLGQMGINLLLNYRRAYIESEAEIEAYQWTFEKLVQVHSSDDCFSCFCFLGGCTPFKAFWDGFTRFGTNLLPQDFARGWLKCIRMLQNKLSKEHSVAALRRITFDALNLPHTCCEIGISTRKSVLAQEEIDEIHREQDSLLSLFSNLLTELNLVALEDRGGKPFIISDPEEFWLHRWLPRMEETLHSLDGDKITDEERSAGEVLGVVWGPPRAEVLKPEYVMKTLTPEYVMKEVAKIMNE
ncbi:hypothetical protein NPX13_g462 [Xylaria arbuscula]|uniref:Fungal N-terminal domain-containing protein n=1 Tax=Xylaria arbuscula TaxID=114810 RepID=A0A9W8NNW8_9PEZI|nr:hypothetical protein NPX13_g462 [Xylaria arbuscula]